MQARFFDATGSKKEQADHAPAPYNKQGAAGDYPAHKHID
jgi:hypothetical protein